MLAFALLLQFLSMKLATVNPELNIDIERILSKDVSKKVQILLKIWNLSDFH